MSAKNACAVQDCGALVKLAAVKRGIHNPQQQTLRRCEMDSMLDKLHDEHCRSTVCGTYKGFPVSRAIMRGHFLRGRASGRRVVPFRRPAVARFWRQHGGGRVGRLRRRSSLTALAVSAMAAPRVDLEAMCLLCMTEEEVVLFSLRAGQVPPRFEVPSPVASKIRKLFNINMFQDGMPDKICHSCLLKVDMFYQFYSVVESGQYKLMVILNKPNDADKPEGGNGAESSVMTFNKFKRTSFMRPLDIPREVTAAPSVDRTAEEQSRNVPGKITITRPKPPDLTKVRVQPYSVPQGAQASTSGPKIKSVALKVHNLELLKQLSGAGGASTQQTPGRFITQLFPNHASVRQSGEGAKTPEGGPPGSHGTDAEAGKTVTKKEASPDREQFPCEICSQTFHLRRPLLRHILTHYQDNIYTCHVPLRDCEAKVWFSSSEFREHMVTKHRKAADDHVVTALSQRAERNSKAEVCSVCMVSLGGSLERHMQVAHKGYHCCKVCRKWFTSARALQAHSVSHEGGKLD